ncbi:MAG TPA: L-erythro-3,5-diaminohexanoate dehydrogenase [Myxococcota bacterium]|nr:L-erythro-3,5-diaminohexanoate dehydrogenase [Myxococcota bacterium]HNZ04233.1 L-erythro-3,5-diaminohexanoate dehydrogenase [Myxococcota bacterium]HOD08248.1 L-erythro-3,5-diaminohexanoate dehydrogenase [Myxococcota bacterium]HPB50629.1 L-erythro-3,5-diaminohexanoate dehydrogenase [Myxococcota bacterium]HQP95270.1 L-erythro-3,5-diaminohexanoate dehydrogenase [Myxococcota bacterium]
MKGAGTRYGTHRVIEPAGALPQAAWKVDNSLPIDPSEMLIDVEMLNIDAASFTQMKTECGGNPEGVAELIMKTVNDRGKQHNPVTGSGGMLVGRIREIGAAYDGPIKAVPGDRIATLVSLSLTPLRINRIKKVFMDRDQVEVEGYAILFSSGIGERLPDDFPRDAALAALDVAGAPAQVYRLVKPGMNIGIIGTGKSGLLCAAAARKMLGDSGRLFGVVHMQSIIDDVAKYGYFDELILADATSPVAVFERINELTDGRLLDVTINTTNVRGTEMSTVLSTRDGGIAYFFNMATSFTAATLGAEGAGKDVSLLMGNGYAPGHAEATLDLIRSDPKLMKLFGARYSS